MNVRGGSGAFLGAAAAMMVLGAGAVTPARAGADEPRLVAAGRAGDAAAVERLLADGADVGAVSVDRATA